MSSLKPAGEKLLRRGGHAYNHSYTGGGKEQARGEKPIPLITGTAAKKKVSLSLHVQTLKSATGQRRESKNRRKKGHPTQKEKDQLKTA